MVILTMPITRSATVNRAPSCNVISNAQITNNNACADTKEPVVQEQPEKADPVTKFQRSSSKTIPVALVKPLQISDAHLMSSSKDAPTVNPRTIPQSMDSKQWTQNSNRLHSVSSSTLPNLNLEDQLGALENVMRQECCYETPKGQELRKEILHTLNSLANDWIKSLSLEQKVSWHNVDKLGGRIVTYGSYMLGISQQGADIDALCVAPRFINRSDFFVSFYELLFHRLEVQELRAIEEAYVPVIKFKFRGIEIDLTFARLCVDQVPISDTDLLDTELFNHTNLDSRCLRSLNGYRASWQILQFVPDVEKFQVTLRAVKLWAQSQGIYSNILGYLGGFSWAVLVAKLCVDYPSLSAPELVQQFFDVYKSWPWPKPVALTNYQQVESSSPNWDMSYGSTAWISWNPEKNVQERYQVMPILTPTFPHQNSTFNVTNNTLRLIREKMCVASEICSNIKLGSETWEALFQTCHIFHEYEHFLIIGASANQTQAKSSILWFGLIESKIRHFINNLEKECRNNLESARIWPKPFAKRSEKNNTSHQLWFVGLKFKTDEKFDYTKPMQSFHEMLLKQSSPFYTRDMKVEAHYLLRDMLTTRLSESEIQEIVSSQSQKAREIQPSRHNSRHGSSDDVRNPSYASVVNKKEGNRAFLSNVGVVSTDRPPIRSLPTLPFSLVPPPQPVAVGTAYFGSPRSNMTMRLQQQRYHQGPRIMERKWDLSPVQGYLQTHGAKLSFDRSSVGHADYHDRSSIGGESTSSAHGLDVSYGSMDSDTGRSVSYSSDKFPPQTLLRARINHLERIPVCSMNHTSRNGCMYVSTPTYDTTVPPPPSPNLNVPSFSSLRPLTLSSQQRMSATEIRDVTTPQPVQSQQYPPLRFNFQSQTLQQIQAAQDSVFN